MAGTAVGRLISGVLFDSRSGARHPTSECMSWILPRLVGGGVCSRWFFRSGCCVAAAAGPSLCRSDQSRPKSVLRKISAERGDWSSPLRPVHPGDPCAIVAATAIWDGTLGRGLVRRVRAGRVRGRARPPPRGSQRPVCGTGRADGSSLYSVRHRAAGRSHGATIGWPAAEEPRVLWR